MSAERVGVPQIETVRRASVTTVRKLLGDRSVPEPIGLSLRNAPLHITSSHGPDGITYAAFLDVRLHENSLLDFLIFASPNGEKDSRDGVKNDWRLPEAKNLNWLIDLHKTLGAEWEEFDRHREHFIEAIRLPSNTFLDFGELLSGQEAQAEDVVRFSYTTGGILIPEKTSVGSVHSRRDYTITPVEDPTEQQDRYVIDAPHYTGTGNFIVGPNSPRVHFATNLSTVQRKNVLQLVPLFQWKQGNTGREWIFDSPTEGLAEGCGLQTLGRRELPDTLVGLMALGYFAQDTVTTWPIREGLVRSKKINAIGAAQIPVFANVNRGDLFNSPLINAMEAHMQLAA